MEQIQQHIQTVREAIEKATPGPWTPSALAGGYVITDYPLHNAVAAVIEYNEDGSIYKPLTDKWRENRHLIANSPTWLQTSIDLLEQQQREIERLWGVMQRIVSDIPYSDTPAKDAVKLASDGLFPKEDQTPPERLNKYRVAFAIHGYDGIKNVVTKSSRNVVAPNEEKAEEIVLEEVRRLHKYESVVSLGVTLLEEGFGDVQDDR